MKVLPDNEHITAAATFHHRLQDVRQLSSTQSVQPLVGSDPNNVYESLQQMRPPCYNPYRSLREQPIALACLHWKWEFLNLAVF